MSKDESKLTKDMIECVHFYIMYSTDEEIYEFKKNNSNIFSMLAIIKEMMDKGLKPSQFGTYVDMKLINAYEYIKNKSE